MNDLVMNLLIDFNIYDLPNLSMNQYYVISPSINEEILHSNEETSLYIKNTFRTVFEILGDYMCVSFFYSIHFVLYQFKKRFGIQSELFDKETKDKLLTKFIASVCLYLKYTDTITLSDEQKLLVLFILGCYNIIISISKDNILNKKTKSSYYTNISLSTKIDFFFGFIYICVFSTFCLWIIEIPVESF